MRIFAGLVMIATASPAIALAQEGPRDGHAVTSLRHQLRNDPDDRVAMVNLAREYLQRGRTAKAQRLYRQLLDMEDVALERVGGAPVSSHWLATQALRHSPVAPPVRISSRR